MKQITLTATEADALSSILMKLSGTNMVLPTNAKPVKKLTKAQEMVKSFENQLSKKFR